MTSNLFEQQSEGDKTQVLVTREDWVGEGKKYASEEEAFKAFGHAQFHVENLERQIAEANAELLKRQSVEEALETLGSKFTSHATGSDQSGESQEGEGTGNEPDVFTKDQVQDLVRSEMSEAEKQRARKDNEVAVQNTLVGRFGDGAGKVVEDKAAELGKSLDDLRLMAQTDPNVFIALFPKPAGGQQMLSSESNVNLDSSTGKTKSHRTYSDYEKLRKEDSHTYWSPRTQMQMGLDSQEYGDAFYD